jgi:uncharacterized repeat protein (TIGR01451 family)
LTTVSVKSITSEGTNIWQQEDTSMMFRSNLLIGLGTGLLVLAATAFSGEAQVPHTVMGSVRNSDESVPAAGELTFESWLIDISNGNVSSETRSQSDPGNAYGDGIMGAGWFETECGNFTAFDWAEGDSLVIFFTNSANGEVGRLACELFAELEPQVVADVHLHQPTPQWTMQLEGDQDTVRAGEELVYSIDYRNSGSGQATAAAIVDTIPSDTEYQSCTGGGSRHGRVVTWNLGTVSSGDSGTVTLTVRVDDPLPNGTVVHNRAHASCAQGVGGSASEATTVRSAPEWSFDLSDSPDPADAGNHLTYTIQYQNTGTDAATGVTIADSIPAHTTYWSNTGGGSYDGHRVTWTIGTVEAGGSGTVTLTVLVDWPLLNGTVIDHRSHLTCSQGIGASDDETTTVSPDLAPPTAATDLLSQMESFDLLLNWSAIDTDIYGQPEAVQGYIIYRHEIPFFTATSVESIATVTDTFFIDGGSRAGDAGVNSFYLIRGVDFAGNVGTNSNRVGEIDFHLPDGSGYMMMANSLDDGSTALASELGDRVPNCTAVKEWDASTRAYVSRAFKVDDTWYGSEPVSSGYPYYLFVGASSDSLWTLTGRVPSDPSFQLAAPTNNDYNTISLPLSSDIGLARDLGASIPHCTAVKEWDERTQGYVSLAFKVGDSWFGGGSVQRGHPYYVNVTASGIWPPAKTEPREIKRASRDRW